MDFTSHSEQPMLQAFKFTYNILYAKFLYQ